MGFVNKLLLLQLLYCIPVGSVPLDFFLDPPDTGFFIKPLFKGSEYFSMNVVQRHFMIWQPRGQVSIKAVSDSFAYVKQLPFNLQRDALNNQTGGELNHIFVDGLDISAHIVSLSLTPDRPLLQVLFHSSSLISEPVKNTTRSSAARREGKQQQQQQQQPQNRWCLQVHAEKAGKELIGSCLLDSQEGVCIAEIKLPATWWDTHQTQTVDVFYAIHQFSDGVGSCTTGNVTRLAEIEHEHWTSSASSVTLTTGQLTYQELKEDLHILVYIPRRSFYLGSVVRVPVKLQADSDLRTFTVRVKTRQGVRVVGAESNNPRWTITTDSNHRKYASAVNAKMMDDGTHSRTERQQDPVFDWVFEVEEDTGEERGRLSFSLEYERGNQGTVSNKVQAFIDIQHDNIYAIVPVIKTTEILNTAVLTGKTLTFPMKIYSVSQGGKMSDITAHTTCHSADDGVLKVAQSCHMVYVDGTESKGSASVSVIAKYGPHTKFLYFRVWTPQLPLTIDISDNRLSLIKDWIVPTRRNTGAASRVARDVKYGILTNKEQVLEEEGVHVQAEDLTATCHTAYQQALVEVYANFIVPDDSHHQYLIHRKALLRVTDLVMASLRVADPTVASLRGNVVGGLKPGRTEIQVMTQTGKVLTSREIQVAKDKVTIDGMQATLVTGLTFDLAPEQEIPGVLVANINRSSRFLKKGEDGIIDLTLKFSDGAQLPLHYFSRDDYFIDTSASNSKMLDFTSYDTSEDEDEEFSVHQAQQPIPEGPRVHAIGQGQGKLLEVTLELGVQCQDRTKKTHPLAVGIVEGVIEFPEDTQSDISVYPSARDSPGNRDTKGLGSQRNGEAGSGGKSAPVDDALVVTDSVSSSMPLLEKAMYILLALLCLAMAVFMVNCFVCVMNRRKRSAGKPSYVEATKGTVTQAHDWVWIGRDTLERTTAGVNQQQPQQLQQQSATLPASQMGTPHVLTATWNRQTALSLGKHPSSADCNIRITANPMMVPDSAHSTSFKDEQQSEASDSDGCDDGADCEECAMMAQEHHGEDEEAAFCDECHLSSEPYGISMKPMGACSGEIPPRHGGGNGWSRGAPHTAAAAAATWGPHKNTDHLSMGRNKHSSCAYSDTSWKKAMEDNVLWSDASSRPSGCWVPADPDDQRWKIGEEIAEPLLAVDERRGVNTTSQTGSSVRSTADPDAAIWVATTDMSKASNGTQPQQQQVNEQEEGGASPHPQLISYFDHLRESSA